MISNLMNANWYQRCICFRIEPQPAGSGSRLDRDQYYSACSVIGSPSRGLAIGTSW